MNVSRRTIESSTRSLGLALLLPLLASCGSNGGGHGNPAAPNPPSSQSGTLVVVASAAASDDGAGGFNTDFTVSVADTGTAAPASGATVEFSTPAGTVSLVEDAGSPGTYRAQVAGHSPGALALSVVRGLDVASGVVEMPVAHSITSPAANDTLDSNGSLDVSWSRAAAAQEAWIATKDWQTGAQADDGSGRVPRGHNNPRNDQSVAVIRRNSVVPAAMAAGSSLQASIRVEIQPVVVQ
jgi:hypothetical protein